MIFWRHILDKLRDGQKLYFLTVIENHGSSPGRKGFKMLVAEDGFIFGSIGGGVMEFGLVSKVKELILEKNPPTFIKKQIHKKNTKDGSGMICSGEQTIAFHCLNESHITTLSSIQSCLENGEKGTLRLNQDAFQFSTEVRESQFLCNIKSESEWAFEEQIGYSETLYIIGGGHVSVAVSDLFVNLGFYVVVIDNRENLNTLENNDSAHQKLVADYNVIDKHIAEGDVSYVAIMTNKYTDDKLVVSKLLRNRYKFIGVLGSEAKVKTLRTDLFKEGFTPEEVDNLQAPIGLQIKSETPEEIAVSIAAQLIQARNIGGGEMP